MWLMSRGSSGVHIHYSTYEGTESREVTLLHMVGTLRTVRRRRSRDPVIQPDGGRWIVAARSGGLRGAIDSGAWLFDRQAVAGCDDRRSNRWWKSGSERGCHTHHNISVDVPNPMYSTPYCHPTSHPEYDARECVLYCTYSVSKWSIKKKKRRRKRGGGERVQIPLLGPLHTNSRKLRIGERPTRSISLVARFFFSLVFLPIWTSIVNHLIGLSTYQSLSPSN